ncbi:MAG: hypothetical protein RPT25_16010 [Cycloclasticus sp.]
MSISLTLIPLALGIRAVMGKEKFEKWVESQKLVIPTNLVKHSEVMSTLRATNYDAIEYGSLIKTHLLDNRGFFFWEEGSNRWNAVFSIHHKTSLINQVINDIELNSEDSIFRNKASINRIGNKILPTNFHSKDLLMQSLRGIGAKPRLTNREAIVCEFEGIHVKFSPMEDGCYGFLVPDSPVLLGNTYKYLDWIEEDYKQCVQKDVYKKLLSRSKSRGLIIESEEINSNNEITITLSLN